VFFSLVFETATESDWIPYGQRYSPFPVELLDPLVALCKRRRNEMYDEARLIWIDLGRPEGEI